MRKIKNPFVKNEDYNCFACSPKNELGLQMNFYEDGDYVCSEWAPKEYFQGYHNILHGGIQATLIDEIAAWTAYIKAKKACVTAKMDIKYKKAVLMDTGNIILKGKIKELKKNICTIEAYLLNSNQEVCVMADVTYFLFSDEVSKNDYNYPGYDSFFE